MIDRVLLMVEREYDVSEVRVLARKLGEQARLSYRECFYLMTAVTELANNLCFHASRGGVIRLALVRRQDACAGVEIGVEDDGPGIADIAAALEDGFSTNGGLGGGLPGVRRLMDEFEIASEVGKGTRVVARIWRR